MPGAEPVETFTPLTYNGCAYTCPSSEVEWIFPKLSELTLTGVSAVSERFWPVLAASL